MWLVRLYLLIVVIYVEIVLDEIFVVCLCCFEDLICKNFEDEEFKLLKVEFLLVVEDFFGVWCVFGDLFEKYLIVWLLLIFVVVECGEGSDDFVVCGVLVKVLVVSCGL